MTRAEDLAYFAGIVDGEGSLSIVKSTLHQSGRITSYYVTRMSVSNTNMALIKWITKRFGGHGATQYKEGTRNPKWKAAYYVGFSAGRLKTLLPTLLPYLVIKQKQANLLIEFLALRESKRHVYNSLSRRFIQSPYSTRELEIVDEIKRLNRRGVMILS